MDKGLYVAMTGASASLKAQAAVAHNLANADTTGFKAMVVGTESYQIQGKGLPTRFDALQIEPGYDARHGALVSTGNQLDVALSGDSWLAVQDANGRTAYTRNGELHVDPTGLLKTSAGETVLDDGGNPLALPPSQQLTVGADGTISMVPLGEGPRTLAIVARMQVAEAAPGTLERGPDGLFRPPPQADGTPAEPLPQAAGNVMTAGALEQSNVDAAGMLVSMIQLARQFEMQVKVLNHGDENAQAANSLLRLS
ncbi:flagellar basal body rod protein FlgF [Coralloluteibacterium stylophorae]|uniref:Flagellar basal-body rod protein FlgF n=1 Tax=Coralloluteibacterium stylophorae TaxID=1776034 RepID=A0A8J7VTH8_9GAMM|nr:flagellar basal body rod protein FlgF [Coralloluteibacterium stylophorae]MBS7457198.1 flagellar basal body rod protein FlgF [Coralloluteibacterium stylophorae]